MNHPFSTRTLFVTLSALAASSVALAQSTSPRPAPPPGATPTPAPSTSPTTTAQPALRPPTPPSTASTTTPPNSPSTQPPAPQPPARPPAPGELGGPLVGLTAEQLAQFRAGSEAFRHRETVDSGLGPIFNDVSCIACHNAGGPGGASRRTVTRFGFTDSAGRFDPLADRGGSLLQDRAIDPAYREVLPRAANTVARRVTTPLFGAGLIEAIPDSAILARAAASKPDGVTGRAALVNDVTTGEQRVGRFGWKAQHATLLAFSADAFVNEMGITNRFFPEENAPNGNTALLATADEIQDPEDASDASGRADIDRAADFMRLLAPPSRGPATAAVTAGENLFATLACNTCHTPSYTTGDNAVAALSRKTVPLYSDLLLHDMGALGDGIAQGPAGPRDLRTAPLWGLASRPAYLHDGRATTVDAAIRAHAGEAAPSRDRYLKLNATQQSQLVAFLRSL